MAEAWQIGELDQRVTLESATLAGDGAGGATQSWAAYATVWAKVRPMTGRERMHAERQEASADYLVVIRRRSDVLEKHRVGWRGRYLNVRFVREAGPRKAYLVLEAEMGAPG